MAYSTEAGSMEKAKGNKCIKMRMRIEMLMIWRILRIVAWSETNRQGLFTLFMNGSSKDNHRR